MLRKDFRQPEHLVVESLPQAALIVNNTSRSLATCLCSLYEASRLHYTTQDIRLRSSDRVGWHLLARQQCRITAS